MPKTIVLFRPHDYELTRGGNKLTAEDAEHYISLAGTPIALLYIAAPLVAAGYEVKIIDEVHDFAYAEHLQADVRDALCVGITMIGGDQVRSALRFAGRVRALTSAPLIWGGYHISALPEQSLQDSRVDVAVVGEGEATLLEIVQALEQGRSLEGIKGCWYKQDGIIHSNPRRELIDLDKLPPLPYHLLDIKKYIYHPKPDGNSFGFRISTSRGCPHSCRFCSTNILQQWRWRYHKTESIIELLAHFIRDYHINYFFFMDDNFFVSQARVREFCQAVIAAGLKFSWAANCRMDYLQHYEPEFIALLQASGLDYLGLGIESGSPKILAYIDKAYDPPAALRNLKRIDAQGIHVHYSMLLGLPVETKPDVYATLKFFSRISALPHIGIGNFALYKPMPGTPIYQECLERNLPLPQSLEAWGDFINMPPVYPPELSRFYDALMKLLARFKRKSRLTPWLALRLWLLYALKWEWTLYLSAGSKIPGLMARLKRKLTQLLRGSRPGA